MSVCQARKRVHKLRVYWHTKEYQSVLINDLLNRNAKGCYMYSGLFKKCLVTSMLIFSALSFAKGDADKTPIKPETVKIVSQKLNALNLELVSVAPFTVDGLYEVLSNKGIFYVSGSGQYLIDGNVYDLDNKANNLTEASFKKVRKNKLKAFEKDMIVFKAAQEKHVITVFTDITCVYCQKLHADIDQYNNKGITVRYLAFPRGGLKSSTYHSMISVWCADDPKMALDKAERRQKVEYKTCDNNVKEQYELGVFFGIKGTPAIILEDGTLQPGYVPADYLANALDK